MSIKIEKVKDFEELSLFLAEINKQNRSHIGYCGQNPEGICQTLKEDFIGDDGDVKFLLARNNIGEIVAAIGLDIDESSAEVWGPFNKTTSISLQHKLWRKLINANPIVQFFDFFINKENTQQQIFMNEIKAEKTGEHLNLEVIKQSFDEISEKKSIPFTQDDFQAFESLHNQTFPETYYNAKTIIERLSSENILKVLKINSNELQGYAYYEVDIEMADASLEYIGIDNKFRNKGLGTTMLKEVLTEMFSYPQIKEIRLTVNNINSQANHVYLKAGFVTKDKLNSYHLKL